MPLAPTDAAYLRDLVLQKSGNVISPRQEYLFESRLAPVLKRRGIDSLTSLVTELRKAPKPALVDEIAEAMTINETSFFRDVAPFDALRTAVLPKLMQVRQSQKQIKIWCAASSSGQEPYTLAMTCCETGLHLTGWNCRILATDVSQEMVDRCKTATYSQFEVNRGLPAKLLVKYFDRENLNWRVKADLQKMVEFRKLNLLENWPFVPQMDIIFIRNVLIYFDRAKKEDILKRAHRLLAPDGYLFLGGGETLINLNCPFVRETIGGTVCYRPTQ